MRFLRQTGAFREVFPSDKQQDIARHVQYAKCAPCCVVQ